MFHRLCYYYGQFPVDSAVILTATHADTSFLLLIPTNSSYRQCTPADSVPFIPSLVGVHKLVVLAVGKIGKGLVADVRVVGLAVLLLHRVVLDLGRLAVGDTGLLLLLVHHSKDGHETGGEGCTGNKDTEDSAETLVVDGGTSGEEEGADNVANGGTGVAHGDGDRLLGVTTRVTGEPREEERVTAEEETNHVVTEEKGSVVLLLASESVEETGTEDTGEHECDKHKALVAVASSEEASCEANSSLHEAEGDVEQDGLAGVETEALDDEGTESVGDGGTSLG